MTWTLGPRQCDMHLSKAVPLAIREALPGFMRRLCANAGIDLARDQAEMLFAIHPGGPKILDHARDAPGASP